MVPPLERRLQLVTGKGGTGKTTLVAALGLAHAARGKRPLLVELGHRASITAHFAGASIAHDPREVHPGVFAVNIDTERATRELVLRSLPGRRFASYALSAGPVRAFLAAAPAVAEVATLDRLRTFVDESAFDPILVDGDATGHAQMLFGVSGVLLGLGATGPVGALTARFASVFADASLAAVHVVSLPTSLAVEETLALREVLRGGGRVALGVTVLNRVEGAAAAGLDLDTLARVERAVADVDAALASEVALLRVDAGRGQRAETLAARLIASDATLLRVSERATDSLDRDGLCALGHALLAGSAGGA